jgi:hypothetical protein
MAFVVARPGGRFEIRESLHTARGPRSRTLASFGILTDDVMAAAARRAQRPFDAAMVIRSGRRAGARMQVATSGADRARDRFLGGSKRMASAPGGAPTMDRTAPGAALMELLGFADMIRASQPPRPFEPLQFPALSHLAEQHVGAHISQRP